VTTTEISRPRHPALAAFLSFVFPGLGQAYAGERRTALLLALPVAVLVAAAAVAALLAGDEMLNQLLSEQFLRAALVVDVVLLVWRLAAIAHAAFSRPETPSLTIAARVAARPGSFGVVALLLAVTLAMHAWAGVVLTSLDAALGDVFSGETDAGGGGYPLNLPDYHWDGTARINFLLLGIDAAPGREESLTDTILVVSVDPVAETAVMVSVPRDTGYIPLPDRRVYPDGLYPHKVNALSTEANANPGLWCPDLPPSAGKSCGLRTLERSVGLYLGLPIHYYAKIDLLGFTEMIDAVGGLELCLPGNLVDPTYHTPGTRKLGIELEAGCKKYDGRRVLAYARSRKGVMELPDGTVERQNDFRRARRQQEVLLKLRKEFAKADPVFELPALIQATGRTVVTDFPRARAGDLASLLPLITGESIRREVLSYPRYLDPPLDPQANYQLIPRRNHIRTGIRELMGPDVELEGWYLGSRADGPPESKEGS
jgi:polyisoprenyl-teichoic acid--peptidoglycan teichoic acid transferase